MERSKYEKPIFEAVNFGEKDVIATSLVNDSLTGLRGDYVDDDSVWN